jgi:hypothetical protein
MRFSSSSSSRFSSSTLQWQRVSMSGSRPVYASLMGAQTGLSRQRSMPSRERKSRIAAILNMPTLHPATATASCQVTRPFSYDKSFGRQTYVRCCLLSLMPSRFVLISAICDDLAAVLIDCPVVFSTVSLGVHSYGLPFLSRFGSPHACVRTHLMMLQMPTVRAEEIPVRA